MAGTIELKRRIYQKIDEWMKGPYEDVLVIKGARQIGKTYLIERYLKNNCKSYLKIDFVEDSDLISIFKGSLETDAILNQLRVLYPTAPLVPNETVLFIDEIQQCPEAWTSLKYFVLDGRFRVIASGSLLGLLHKESASNPVGYARFEDMYPLDFEEFLWAIGLDEHTTSELRSHISDRRPYGDAVLKRMDDYFSFYMIVGGMPEAVAKYIETKDYRAVREVQKKILEGYRLDVVKYAEDSDKGKIISCFDSLPAQLSQDWKKFSYKLIDSDLTPAYRTYEGAIDWLVDAAIVVQCFNLTAPAEPMNENKIDNQFKIYMGDTGLLVCMLGANVAKSVMSDDTRVNRGAVTENVVSDGLRKCGFDLYYFRKNQLEIDFIVVLGSDVSAIEVKSGNNRRSRSLDSLKEKYGVKRRMKFERSDIYMDKNGIEHYPLFASAFADMLAPEPEIDLAYDIDGLKSLLEPDHDGMESE